MSSDDVYAGTGRNFQSSDLRIWLSASLFVMVLAIWVSSGTLAPYAATHHMSLVLEPCDYLANLDHPHFLGPVNFLNGEPLETWQNSILLRRILYPLLALPFFRIFGFEFGGFIANILITLLAVVYFVLFIGRQHGPLAARGTAALLVTYPGIVYWSGLPYSYAAIVPCYLVAFSLLWYIYLSPGATTCLLCSFGIGILSLGYDLVPFFLPSTMIVLALKTRFSLTRRFGLIAGTAMAMIIPSVMLIYFFKLRYGISPVNSNSSIYGILISSYLHPQSLSGWMREIVQVPYIFVHNFFYSNFIFIPALFVFAIGLHIFKRTPPLHTVEYAFLGTVLALFLFNNAAPPYENTWQMRGVWIARLYQPIFVVYISYIARCLAGPRLPSSVSTPLLTAIWITVILNSLTIFGPIFGYTRLAAHSYHNFYQQDSESSFTNNLTKFGRRPIGFCKAN